MKKIVTTVTVLLLAFTALAQETRTFGDFEYIVENETATITNYYDTSTQTHLVVPQILGGYSVTSIGDSAFLLCDSLVLKVHDKSYAHEYAKQEGMSYEFIPDTSWL